MEVSTITLAKKNLVYEFCLPINMASILLMVINTECMVMVMQTLIKWEK